MGQELRSCDTTQIDEKFVRSLMRTIIRTPIDNGRDPVGIYSSKRFFKPPSEVHSFRTDDRDLTPPTVLLTTASRNYYSSSQV